MNAIIDMFRSLGDVLMVLAMWSGAAGLMWLGDEVKARKKFQKKRKGSVTADIQPQRRK